MLFAVDFINKSKLEKITMLVDDIKKGEMEQTYLLSPLIKSCLKRSRKESVEAILADLKKYCWEEISKDNVSNAFYLLGWMNCFIYCNYNEAIRFYDQAIALGHVKALNARANMYQHGKGDEQNYGTAIELYERAIKLGSASAMTNRAYMHYKGLGGEENYESAIELFEQAIKLGNASAMYYRGIMYKSGCGYSDDKKAVRLFVRAIELGYENAVTQLCWSTNTLFEFHCFMNLRMHEKAAKLLKKHFNDLISEFIECYCNSKLENLKVWEQIDDVLNLFKDSDEPKKSNLYASVVIALNTYEQTNGYVISNKEHLLSQINIDKLEKEMLQPVITTIIDIWGGNKEVFTPCAAQLLSKLILKIELTEHQIDPGYLKIIASILVQNQYGNLYDINVGLPISFDQILCLVTCIKWRSAADMNRIFDKDTNLIIQAPVSLLISQSVFNNMAGPSVAVDTNSENFRYL